MQRAVQTLIRIIAAALIVFGGLQLTLEYARYRTATVSWGQVVLGFILILGGIGLFVGSGKLAEKITDTFEP